MLHRFPRIFERRSRPALGGPAQYLIVGLGNPGKEYEGTRHNVGFAAVEKLAADMQISIKKIKFKSLCGEGELGGAKVLLLKPSTFMNRSGAAVKEAASFYKIPPERILIISDDVALAPGRVRIRRKGSDGGHNGLKDIIYLLGSDEFPRIKIGVGEKPHPDYDLAKWVLGRPGGKELQAIETVLDEIPAICRLIVDGNIEKAMGDYNAKT